MSLVSVVFFSLFIGFVFTIAIDLIGEGIINVYI
jgi:hypothetical protein